MYRSPFVVGCVILASAVMIASPIIAYGKSHAVAPNPTVVAAVDYSRVVQSLQQFAQAQVNVTQKVEQLKAEGDKWTKELEALDARVKDESLSPGEHRKAQEDFALKALEFKNWQQFAQQDLDIDRSILFQEVDRAIMREIEELAQIGGYDLVITDDSGVEIGARDGIQAPREDQVKAQMNARRVLYASEIIDVTDELILRMNNRFNAG